MDCREELKPCPFCGGKADWDFESDVDTGIVLHWEAYCTNCFASIRDPIQGIALATWNTRAPISQQAELTVEQIKAAIRKNERLSSEYTEPGTYLNDEYLLKIAVAIHAALPTESKDEEWQQAGLTPQGMWDEIQAIRKLTDDDGTTGEPNQKVEQLIESKDERINICPTCEGVAPTQYDYQGDDKWSPCPECNGSGFTGPTDQQIIHSLTAQIAEMTEKLEFANTELRNQTFHGNSIEYWWQKAKAYGQTTLDQCKQIAEMREIQDKQKSEIEQLKAQLSEYIEAEAAICPEDRSFTEVIQSLQSELTRKNEQIKRLRNAIQNTTKFMESEGLSASTTWIVDGMNKLLAEIGED